MPNSDLLRIGKAAKLIGVSGTTLRRWADEGRLKAYRIGVRRERRFRREDVLALLEGPAPASDEPAGRGE